MPKNARTFSQDLMRGEHVLGRGKRARGVLIQSDSGRDPAYYAKKREAEKRLGRKLTTAEFQEQYYQAGITEHDTGLSATGTSVFDPVLCELVYRWFCPPKGRILDPFAGGSVRGVVAGFLGYEYRGVDLSDRQVKANREQARAFKLPVLPFWFVGDSAKLQEVVRGEYDLVFSCPPYADLERYSDDPRDLSTMDYPAFLDVYRRIIAAAVGMLAPDRFACFVVGDVRDPDGIYRGFVCDTIAAFAAAGAGLYNEAVLLTSAGSLPIRVGKQFTASRKLGKTHQNVLVFVKGDPKKATAAVGPVEFGELDQLLGGP